MGVGGGGGGLGFGVELGGGGRGGRDWFVVGDGGVGGAGGGTLDATGEPWTPQVSIMTDRSSTRIIEAACSTGTGTFGAEAVLGQQDQRARGRSGKNGSWPRPDAP